jgi:hypothetical protein
VSTAELLEIAHRGEPAVTERTLELWRHQDLLPKAQRTGQRGTRPIWTYPGEAVAQLQALIRLRTATKDPNLLRSALWFEGHPVPTARVQTSMIAVMRKVQADVAKELGKRAAAKGHDDELGRSQAIADVARELAARRGRGLPRFGRQPSEDRAQGVETMFRLLMGEDPALAPLDQQAAAAAERFMGLDQARRYHAPGTGPWLTSAPAEGLASFQQFGSLPRLIEAVESADEDEFEQARPLACTFMNGIAAFSQLADAFAGYRNAAGLAAVEAIKDQPLISVMATAFIISGMRASEMALSIREVNAALIGSILPTEAAVKRIAEMPEAEREARIGELPWPAQRRIRRMIGILHDEGV